MNDLGVRELFIGGLATDYCVKSTVLEALKDFKVNLLVDAIKGVNLNPDDSKMAIEKMIADGARKMIFDEFVKKAAKNNNFWRVRRCFASARSRLRRTS